MKDDRRLIREYLGGSDAAFEELYDRHQPALYALAYYLMDNPQDAEDLSQATWLQAIRSLSAFQGRSCFRTWLHAIAMNLYRHQRRDSRL
jgi:RNA polymerase sigma factor (sigma-70 family)